jgi:1-acyl-sn-glycerol-3-phosphate acyltransferase
VVTAWVRTYLLVAPATLALMFIVLVTMIPLTWLLRDIRPIYRVARWVLRAVARLAGVRVEIRGSDPWRMPQPSVYLCNHTSNVDPPIAFLCLPRVSIMGKEVVFRAPLFGYALRLADFIAVNRRDPDSRRKALEAGIAVLRKGISLLIFPEGTRSPDGRLLPFRPGPFTMAIEAQAPVAPITMLGARDIMPKGAWWIRPGRVTLIFHEPISTRGLTQADREDVMRRARAAIASALPPLPSS